MPSQISEVKQILVISLTNIGDVILTLPVVDILHQEHPQAKITMVIGPKAEGLFRDQPRIQPVVYDKHAKCSDKWAFIHRLRRVKYDLVVDLRNTAIPFLVNARRKTPADKKKSGDSHMKEKHLNRLLFVGFPNIPSQQQRVLRIPDQDAVFIGDLLRMTIVNTPFVVMAPGAADPRKRWMPERFAALADKIMQEKKCKVIFTGDKDDVQLVMKIQDMMRYPSINLAGRLDLLQLAALLTRCRHFICNDSGPMHLASYFDVPTTAVFSYTDPKFYGPWGKAGSFVRRNESCPACLLTDIEHTCMQAVTVDDVWSACNRFWPNESQSILS